MSKYTLGLDFGTESARDTVGEIVSIHDRFTCTGAEELA